MARTHPNIILEVKNIIFFSEKAEAREVVANVTLTSGDVFAAKKRMFFSPKVILG